MSRWNKRTSLLGILWIVVLVFLVLVLFFGDSSFWSSRLPLFIGLFGVIVAFSSWLLPASSTDHNTTTAHSTEDQNPSSIIMSEKNQREQRKAKEALNKALEREQRRKSKQKAIRVIFWISILLIVLSVPFFLYFEFTTSHLSPGFLDVPYNGQVTSAAWSPDGRLLALSVQDEAGCVRIWNNAKENSKVIYPTASQKCMGGTATDVAWSADNRHVAFVDSNNKIEIADTLTGEVSPSTIGASATVVVVAWSPTNNRYLAFGTEDKTIQVWDIGTQQQIASIPGHSAAHALAWSFDGKRIVSVDDDNYLHVWDLAAKKEVFSYSDPIGQVASLKGSPVSNSLFASGSDDYTVRIWDTTKSPTENPIKVYKDFTGKVSDIAWSPDGNYMAVADMGGFLHIWDWNTSTQKDVTGYQFHLNGLGAVSELTAVGWSADTRSIAIGEFYFDANGDEAFYLRILQFCKQWCGI